MNEPQSPQAAFCHTCGAEGALGGVFCHACGQSLAIQSAASDLREASQGTAAPVEHEELAQPPRAITATPQLFAYSAPSTAERMRFASRASFGRRVAGFVIDLVVVFTLWVAVGLTVQAAIGQNGGVALGILALAFVLYEWASALSTGTLGMRALGMRIVRVDGQRLMAMTMLVRAMVLFGSGAILVGLFSGLWHPEGRAWHDLASGTGVVSLGSGVRTPR